jgi:hypothetical protein
MSGGPPRGEQRSQGQPQRPAKRPASMPGVGDKPQSHPAVGVPIGRRSLLALLGGGLAVAAAGAYAFLPRRASYDLPIPAGQAVGPEYLAATLAKQPAMAGRTAPPPKRQPTMAVSTSSW